MKTSITEFPLMRSDGAEDGQRDLLFQFNRAAANDFVTWCEQSHLQLNMAKTKDLVLDLRRTKTPVTLISIQGVSVDIVEDYKYSYILTKNWTGQKTLELSIGRARVVSIF